MGTILHLIICHICHDEINKNETGIRCFEKIYCEECFENFLADIKDREAEWTDIKE